MATGDPSVLQMPCPHWSPFNDYGPNPPSSRTARNLHPYRVGGQVELPIAGWASGFEQELYVTSFSTWLPTVSSPSITHPFLQPPWQSDWVVPYVFFKMMLGFQYGWMNWRKNGCAASFEVMWSYLDLWIPLVCFNKRTSYRKWSARLLMSLRSSPLNVAVKLPVSWAHTVCLAMCWVERQWQTGQSPCFGVEDTGSKLLCVAVCFMTWIDRVRWQRVAVRSGVTLEAD